MYYSVKDFTSSTAIWHESLQCIFYASISNIHSILLWNRKSFCFSKQLWQRLSRFFNGCSETCTERRPVCFSYRTFLTSTATWPTFPAPSLLAGGSSRHTLCLRTVFSVEEGGKWFVITGWSDPEVCTQAFLWRAKPCQPVGGEAIVGDCTRRKTTHNPSISSPAWVSPFFPQVSNCAWRIYCQRGLCSVQI